MKQLTEYPTPETDALLERIGDPPYAVNPRTNLCRDLERRLAACRDTLVCLNNSQIMREDAHQAIREVLALTAPNQCQS